MELHHHGPEDEPSGLLQDLGGQDYQPADLILEPGSHPPIPSNGS